MAVTQELVMNFLLEQGGKVKNSELVRRFKSVVDSPDPQQRANNRELFKRFVNNIAVVREEDGGKVVVLKKKYTHLLAGLVQEEGVTQSKGETQQEAPLPVNDNPEEPSVSSDTERSSAQDLSEGQCHNSSDTERSSAQDLSEGQCHNSSDTERSSPQDLSKGQNIAELKDSSVGGPLGEPPDQDKLTNVTLENEERRESVFDMVSRIDNAGPVPVPKSWSDGQAKDNLKPHMLPLRYAQTSFDADQNDNPSVPPPAAQEPLPRNRPQSAPMTAAPLPVLPRSPHVSRRHIDDAGSRSPHMKRASKTMKASEENKYSDVVPLIQHEHEWLVAGTTGRWNHKLLGLMLVDSELADKRDFISGFTALHWAAKSGNTEMIKQLCDLSRKAGTSVNVNVRSFGGYTPLHLAAIHGRKDAILMLVRDYSANVHIRDNSGRKPYHYLNKECALPLRFILKDPATLTMDHAVPLKRNSKVASSILGTTGAFLGVISDDIGFPDLTRGLKKPGLNKFFTAPSGPKKKLKVRDSYPSISSLSEETQELEEVSGKRRPVSEFFSH